MNMSIFRGGYVPPRGFEPVEDEERPLLFFSPKTDDRVRIFPTATEGILLSRINILLFSEAFYHPLRVMSFVFGEDFVARLSDVDGFYPTWDMVSFQHIAILSHFGLSLPPDHSFSGSAHEVALYISKLSESP